MREKSLIALAVAHTVQCPYCIDAYSRDALGQTRLVGRNVGMRGGCPLEFYLDDIPIGDSATLGPKNARITVTMFLDYQCPFSARTFPWLLTLLNDDELKGHVRLVFKHFPLSGHPNAEKAARAAVAAQKQNKFWEMHKALFDNQEDLGAESIAEALAQGAEVVVTGRCADSALG